MAEDKTAAEIAQDPYNSLTSKSGEHPTAATAPVADTTAPAAPAIIPVTAIGPVAPSQPLANYEVFNIFMDDQKPMLASDAIKLFGDLQLEPYDEFFYGVRRAPKT